MILTLSDERPLGWNKFYSGMHWSKRTKEVERVHQVVRAALDGKESPTEHRVKIIVTVYFKNKPLDPDNINAKLYIDALKSWVIYDDTRKHIESVTTISKIDKDNPRIEIEINEQADLIEII